ncbi:MAG TPA: HAMP domain-containing sensor histidine kinase [Nitriliruptorales bacterium]
MQAPEDGPAPSHAAPDPVIDAEVARQLAELDAIRRRVLNVVGHALRTPMATLRGLVEVLGSEPDQPTLDQVVPALVRTTRRLERLLDDVLVASEVTTRLPTAAPSPVRVADVVRKVWSELAEPAELVVEGDAATQAFVGADGLRWMLWHLLDNAATYGQGPVTVALGAEEGGSVVRISSGGPELDPDDLARAFELFYRGEVAVISSASGMGVGLPVVRRLAEHAGGSVCLRARDGGGVTAILRLPRVAGATTGSGGNGGAG